MGDLKTKLKRITPLYNLYLFFFNKKEYLHKKKEKSFLKKLGPFRLIFDIGANTGNKTALFNSLGATVIAVEPDKLNYQLLVSRFKSNKKITVLPFAVSNNIGTATFFLNEPGSAFNTLSNKWKETLEDPEANRWKTSKKFQDVIEVETVTLDHLIDKNGKPDYIKIDVEGHELSCIKGLHNKIPLISLEANLPEFRSETLAIINHLKSIDENVLFNYIKNDENFELKKNVSADEFYNLISETQIKYMDIFSFTTIS